MNFNRTGHDFFKDFSFYSKKKVWILIGAFSDAPAVGHWSNQPQEKHSDFFYTGHIFSKTLLFIENKSMNFNRPGHDIFKDFGFL